MDENEHEDLNFEEFAKKWADIRAETNAYLLLDDNWDGPGSRRPMTSAIVDSVLIIDSEKFTFPPEYHYLAPDGTIMWEWIYPKLGRTSVNIRGNGKMECVLVINGRDPMFWTANIN